MARPIKGGGILIDRVAEGAKHKKTGLQSNTSFDMILRNRMSAKKSNTGSSKYTINLGTANTSKSSNAELLSLNPDVDDTFKQLEAVEEHDDIVMNGKTLQELNMKRGGENGLKYFLKNVVKTQMMAAGHTQSVYDVLQQVRANSGKEIDSGFFYDAEKSTDEESQEAAAKNSGGIKLVIDTEKVNSGQQIM